MERRAPCWRRPRQSLWGDHGAAPIRSAFSPSCCAHSALCCAAPALALEPAGDGWYWQSPQPQGQLLNAVTFAGPLDLWAVGDAGTIMHSVDAGVSWQRVPCPATVPLGSVSFAGSHARLGRRWARTGDFSYSTHGSDGVILHTGDGGITWDVQLSLPSRPSPT